MIAVSLGKLKGEKAIDTLIDMLEEGPLQERRAAAWALERMATQEALCALMQLLHDDDREIRSFAISALGKVYQKEVEQFLNQTM